MATKKAATREQVYVFANKAIELGYGEAAGAAVICYYRRAEKPTFLWIGHTKTGR
jgi:hypothetical protein